MAAFPWSVLYWSLYLCLLLTVHLVFVYCSMARKAFRHIFGCFGEQKRPSFKCPVCFEKLLVEDGMICCVDTSASKYFPQRHRICIDCLRGHAKSAITESPVAPGGVGLTCVFDDCKNVFPLSDFEFYLEPRVLTGLTVRLEHESLVAAEIADLVICPDCGNRYSVDSEFKYYDCSCGRRQCRHCPLEYDAKHAGKECRDILLESQSSPSKKKLSNQLSEIVVRTCPKCQLQVEKIDGCNKLICRCGIYFCYLCRVQVADYRHFCGCGYKETGRTCKDCGSQCPLFADANAFDQDKIDRLIFKSATHAPGSINYLKKFVEKYPQGPSQEQNLVEDISHDLK